LRQFIYIVLFVLTACGHANRPDESSHVTPDSVDEVSNSAPAASEATKLTLDDFTDVPREIEGCSCYYSRSEAKHTSSEYFFVSDFDSSGYVSIENTITKFKLVSTGREPNSFGDYNHVDIFKTDHYTLTLDIKYKKGGDEEDEGWWNEGTITIENTAGQKTRYAFFGSCGC
jgi:hypothetical protein